MEVFCPPRFAPYVEQMGKKAKSYDLKTGYDFTKAADRKTVEDDLISNRPELLVLCPPCTHEGGWFHLNSTKLERWQYLQLVARSRSFIRWCCKLFKMQVDLGGRAVFEHPTGARTWSYPEVQALCRKFTTVKLHMCRYGLKLPESSKLIRKSTRLLASHEDMKCLTLLCPGTADPDHSEHDVVAGSAPGIKSVSEYTAKYPSKFVEAVLDTVPTFRDQPVLCVHDDSVPEHQWNDILAVGDMPNPNESELLPVIKKLHQNLGHPPNHDLVRVLRHGQASSEAINLARDFQCSFCQSQVKPKVALPAQSSRVHDFNHQVGLDVKNLRGWLPNQKVKALNLVDTASGYQRMIPFFQTETSGLLRQLFRDSWITWAGPPKEVVLDPAQTNLGDPMVLPCEWQGTHVRPIAAGAHWQLGKTESHGGWFAQVLDKIIEEHNPQSKEEWLSCVAHAHVKNQMIQVHGHSPHQFVFGRNPHIPEDLLNEPLSITAATASLTEDALARSQAMRVTARIALAKLQDSRAMRTALLARPRRQYEFKPGEVVAYWRSQKWVEGKLLLGGRWHGPAVVIGHVGRNIIVIHRKQLLRCAPEQVRPSTEEEKQLISAPHMELLGVKQLIENGGLPSKNYVDLVPQSYPPQGVGPEDRESMGTQMQTESATEANADAQPDIPEMAGVPPASADASPSEDIQVVPNPTTTSTTENSENPSASSTGDTSRSESAPSNYGPIRRRITGKDGPMSLYRPSAMQQDDFVSIMKDVIPELVEQAIMDEDRSDSTKRPNAEVEHSPGETSEPAESRVRTSEVLSVQDCTDLLSMVDTVPTEVFMAEYLKRKMSKELKHSGNAPELQKKVEEGKRLEWQTMLSKENAVRIHYGKAAEVIKRTRPDRFIGSRFVLTRKPMEEGQDIDPDDVSTFTVKGRWCLQGHLDPDLQVKAESGLLKSPTLSQLGRMTLMQVLSSKQWTLQLGDIKGAFLEAGPLEERFKPLYAHQPPGGIPGLPPSAVIEILGNVYGQNDAPAAWFKEFSTFVMDSGWIQSKLDPCLYTLRDGNQLIGIMGVHVDDTALGGFGQKFQDSITKLRSRFPYRKWRVGEGEFCGAWYKQESDGSIKMHMQSFAEKLRSVNVPKGVEPDTPLSDSQIKVLRAVNGGLNWLSSQSRPDLAVQTSLSQQSFPRPTIHDFRRANQAIRRAKMEKDLGITFKPIPVDQLTVVCHSDAAWANVGLHTQAGYVISFTDKSLQDGDVAQWVPATWRSYKLSRAVSSTLAAESQAMATATGTVEWLMLLLAETLDGPLDVKNCRQKLCTRRPILVTDCKSLYDHLHSPSSPTSIEDRRTSIDVVIIRESCKTMQAFVRWVPTNRMLADAFTKDLGDPIDLLRSCIKCSEYQISPEETVLERQAEEKQQRLNRKLEHTLPLKSSDVEVKLDLGTTCENTCH